MDKKSYKGLEIYIESKQLAIKIHKMSMSLPKFELFEEGGQIRRSSKSVTSMIVEGYCRRRYKADFIKYLVYSHAECDATITHLEILFESGPLKDTELYRGLKGDYEILSRKINNYIKWGEENLNDFPAL